jgi:hypothetical protein
MDKTVLAYIDRVFITIARPCTFYSVAYWTVLKIDYIFAHKTNLGENIKIFPCILINHNGKKLEFRDKENCKSHSNWWRLNNTFLNYQWVIEKIKKEIMQLQYIAEMHVLKTFSELSKPKAKIWTKIPKKI